MSIDYSSALVVGFVVSEETFGNAFKVTLPEEFHMEDRYDSRTGQKLRQEKVVDKEARDSYLFKGKEYEDVSELAEALEKDLKCYISVHGDCYTGYDLQFAIQPLAMKGKTRLGLGDGADMAQACLRIGERFEELGLAVGEPCITSLKSVT